MATIKILKNGVEMEIDETSEHHPINDINEATGKVWTDEERQADYDIGEAAGVRGLRNTYLVESDWTQQPDIPETTRTKWQTYRQQLRDLTKHSNFPHLKEEDWPTKPE